MVAQTLWVLLVLAGMATVWLIGAWGYSRTQRLIADALGGKDAMTGAQWFANLAQPLGTAVLVLAALILLARWRWPEHYGRRRMGGDD